MNWATGVVVFVMVWWVTFFAILPLGVRGQYEAGEVAPGSEPGAPENPNMWRKARTTTLIAVIAFALIYMVIRFELVDLDAIPIGPDYEHLTEGG